MRIYEEKERSEAAVNGLLEVWESSVKATHTFLSEKEIHSIKQYVPQAIIGVPRLFVLENGGKLCGFMGIDGKRLEMLFLLPEMRNKGYGKNLLDLAIKEYGVCELTVNEQNPQAVGFYEHMGFSAYKRTDFDEEGNPYPLLYMKLKGK